MIQVDAEAFQNVLKCHKTCDNWLLEKKELFECMVKSIESSVRGTTLAEQFDEYKKTLYGHLDEINGCVDDRFDWKNSM